MITLVAQPVDIDAPEEGLISVHHWGLFPYLEPRPAKLPFYRGVADDTPVCTVTVRRGDGHLDKVIVDFLAVLGKGYTTTGTAAQLAMACLSREARTREGITVRNSALGTVRARKMGDFLAVDLGGAWWRTFKDKDDFWAALQSFTDLRINIIPAV